MIEITKQNAFILYLGFTLAVVLFLWFMQGLQKSKRYLFDYKEEAFTCPSCGCSYTFSKSGSITACPMCKGHEELSNVRK